MKKYHTNYKKIATVIVAVFIAIPSILNAQIFVDGVVDSIVVTPINLITFTGNKIEKNVQLNWSTVTEKNNSHFNIQRSINGLNFENIGKVRGKGNLSSANNYLYTDVDVPDNNLYYRLQQVDIDGKASLSAVILIKYDKKANSELSVYPNPISNFTATISLRNTTIGKYNVALKSLKGETVFVKTISINAVNSNIELPLPQSLAKGLYVLNIASIDGKINLVEKIIIE